MPYYPEKNILFIHVPKTGGTGIENELKKKYKQNLYNVKRRNKILENPFNKSSLQHQFYSTIYKYRDRLNVNFDKIKIFSVVRNPYNRIISDLFWFRLIKKNFSKNQIYNVIKNKYLYRSDLDNHNLPQYKFLTNENLNLYENIKIFKTEKLNEDNDELNKYLDVDMNIKRENVNKNYMMYLSKESISLINTFYDIDFKLFNYDKI